MAGALKGVGVEPLREVFDMRRLRRRERRVRLYSSIFAGLALVAGGWWLWGGRGAKPELTDYETNPTNTTLTSHDEAPAARGGGLETRTAASGADDESLTPSFSDRTQTPPEVTIAPRVAIPETHTVSAPPPSEPEDAPALGGRDAGPGAGETAVSDAAAAKPQTAAAPTPFDTEIETASPPDDAPANDAVARWLKEYDAGRRIEARNALNRMLKQSLDPAEQAGLRKHLARFADEMVFAGRRTAGDPLLETYIVQSGDVLVRIGKKFDVPAEALMQINHIDHRIREGQQIVAPRGPFHARISKSAFRLDLYLGDTYLRSFPVGLGADGGTPEGEWIVKERLEHPTYYPSPSAKDKRVIRPHDPTNPLGTRWIALEGTKGSAVGQSGYGIHGTIAPDSIGKAESLGCIRMHNADVELLFAFVQPGATTVTVTR